MRSAAGLLELEGLLHGRKISMDYSKVVHRDIPARVVG